MRFEFNRTGAERKALVQAMGEILEVKPKYLGMPTAAYQVDYFHIDKTGAVEFDDRADSEEIENLLERLAERGIVAAPAETAQEGGTAEESADAENKAEEPETEAQGADLGLTVAMPRDSFTDAALENLRKLVDAKGSLIKKALAVDSLPIETDGEKVSFPWFAEGQDSESVKAYTHFIAAICDMARNQKRITAKEKPADNEKYAFRCFLLRLGFIGAEYKVERKILLKNLSGSSAFKNGEPKSETLRPEPVNPAMRVDAGEHPELTEELLDEILIQQVNAGMGGAADGISE
ncbi:virulence protein [Lachnospiraceae bacterium WCA-9-b2]|jgi:hypothetical protein|uniref:Virulence protein n=1 Tax=Sporofaciens musculi TaxID=2681861 RepID=A0A7X3SLH0_9FIRM|nr:virulence protein [Sporofaciens musculi]MXP78400.1 virulence protein [Sporofaciens musculi]